MLLKFKAGRSGDDPELLGKGRNFEKGILVIIHPCYYLRTRNPNQIFRRVASLGLQNSQLGSLVSQL